MTVPLNPVEVASDVPTLQTQPASHTPDVKGYILIIFDKDGTLCHNFTNNENFIDHPGEQGMIPGVVKVCHRLFDSGIHLAIASNQGGVAFGFVTFEEMVQMMVEATIAIKAVAYRACPHHKEGTVYPFNRQSSYRKPQPGMLTSIMDELSVDPEYVLMVGDRDEDFQAAKNAGVEFMWAWEFFGWQPPDDWKAPDEDKGEGYLGDE